MVAPVPVKPCCGGGKGGGAKQQQAPVSSGKGDAKPASLLSRGLSLLGGGGSSSKQQEPLETKEQAPAPIKPYNSLTHRFDPPELKENAVNIAGLWKVRHVGCGNSPSNADFIFSGAPAEVDKAAIVKRLQAAHGDCCTNAARDWGMALTAEDMEAAEAKFCKDQPGMWADDALTPAPIVHSHLDYGSVLGMYGYDFGVVARDGSILTRHPQGHPYMGKAYGVKPQRNMILHEQIFNERGEPRNHHMFLYSEMSGAEIEAYEKADAANALLPDLTSTSGFASGDDEKQTHWFTGVHFLSAERQPEEHAGLADQKFYGKIVQREKDPSTDATLYGILPNTAPAHSSEWEIMEASPVVELQLRSDAPGFEADMAFERAGDHVNTAIEFFSDQLDRRIRAKIAGVHRNLVDASDGGGIGVALKWIPELNGGQKDHGLGRDGLNPLSRNLWEAMGVKYSLPVWEITGGLEAANGALVTLRDSMRPINRVRVGELTIVRWPVEPHDLRHVMVVGIEYAETDHVMPSVVTHLTITDRSETAVHRISAEYFETIGNGQNVQPRHMRKMYFEHSLRFHDRNLDLRMHASEMNEEFLYHERQVSAYCGMHAVNNVFQRRVFVFGGVKVKQLAMEQWNVPISAHDQPMDRQWDMVQVALRMAKRNRATQLRSDVHNGLPAQEAAGQAKMTEVEEKNSFSSYKFSR